MKCEHNKNQYYCKECKGAGIYKVSILTPCTQSVIYIATITSTVKCARVIVIIKKCIILSIKYNVILKTFDSKKLYLKRSNVKSKPKAA